MIPAPLDTIRVEAYRTEELQADHADLFVAVRGSSLVTGTAALKQAREVGELVQDLLRYGIPEADVHLQGASTEVSSGMLTRSSAAHYRLRIRCARLDALADLIGLLNGQKNATLESLAWGYEGEAALRDRLIEACIDQANEKARRVAARLGVTLAGVHAFAEKGRAGEVPRAEGWLGVPLMARQSKGAREAFGFELTHAKSVEVGVEVTYRISGHGPA